MKINFILKKLLVENRKNLFPKKTRQKKNKTEKMNCSRCRKEFEILLILCSKCFHWDKKNFKPFKSTRMKNIENAKCVKCKCINKNVYYICEDCLKLEENKLELSKCSVTGEYCHSDGKNASYNRCEACKEHVFLPYPNFETVLYNLCLCDCQHFAIKDNIEHCSFCAKVVCNCFCIWIHCDIEGCTKCTNFSVEGRIANICNECNKCLHLIP